MMEDRPLQLSSERYYQSRGALQVFPEEVLAHGNSVLIVTDHTVYPKVQEYLEQTLQKSGIRFRVFWFEGFCSPKNYEGAAQAAKSMKASVIAGIGGGRVMDTAKIASDLCHVRCITIPTSAATCAATALLAVKYTDEGQFRGNYWPVHVPAATIADLDVIVSNCPVRYNAAGIVDSMAKYPEISYNMQYTGFWKDNLYSKVACSGANEIYRLLLETGREVLSKMQANVCDQQVENCICATLSGTGLISCLASGGKQAAVSHCLYSFFCDTQPGLARKFLHGEIVGASLPYQLMVDGKGEKQALELFTFLKTINLPACMDDLEYHPTRESLDEMYEYLRVKMPIQESSELERLQAFENVLLHGC
ncbi:MAG: Iron-containing alcohol dehydrogenase [Oscillospiraceae bacterium]|jgi:glycerol dehydrogenase